MNRYVNQRELTHERLGDRFSSALSRYDTDRRVEVLVDEFLGRERLRGAKVLDVGCGLGDFSQRLSDLGADVTACDLGAGLVDRTRARVGCTAVVADALNLSATFEPESFDIVLSSECIEHTPDPKRAVREMARLVKPGGCLSISTPNRLWWPVVRLASILKLRPFDGFENFSSWRGLRRTLAECGLEVIREKGLHAFPFHFRLHALSRWMDENLQPIRGEMINICILAKKPSR
jgi:2-polyprenyl-3-methyl-5-hydroxy-6-metoxy-1,4-benzoquinol methylase